MQGWRYGGRIEPRGNALRFIGSPRRVQGVCGLRANPLSDPPGSFSVSGSITIAAWHYPLRLPAAWRIQRSPPIGRGRAGRP
jgi:hypothetical protein